MYSVPQYLARLKLARRSPRTIEGYRCILGSFARFLDVPIEELHNHLLPDNLINYAASRTEYSERGNRVHLGIIHRFYSLNGAKFDELELNILKPRRTVEQNDKSLDLSTLQKMMDLGDPHSRAILAVLISTGMRAGECCRLRLSDIDGDTITIPNEIAKGGRGGKVYLSAEAREYLDLWLRDRNRYLKVARTKYYSKNIPEDDDRLFCVAYPTLRRIFSHLYDLVDGEKGKYWSKCTIHSCRKYFRTHAVSSIPLDTVEKIMRHTGYLTGSYVRITDDEARELFHAGEAALYITRANHRIQSGELKALKEQNERLAKEMETLRQIIEFAEKKKI
jgi:integrase